MAEQYRVVLRFSSLKVRGDKERVLYIVNRDGKAFRYASEELRRVKEVATDAIK